MIELSPEREAARKEYRRRMEAIMRRAALSRTVWIKGEPVEESDYKGEGKND